MRATDPIQTIHAAQVGRSELALVLSDMPGLHVDAIACYASTSLTLHSNLAHQLVASGGSFIRAEGGKHAPADVGGAVVLPAGKLPGRYLIVGVTNRLREAPTLRVIGDCVGAIVGRAAQLGLSSLAIPSLRVGRLLAPEDIMRAILAPIFDHACGAEGLSRLLIVGEPEESPAQAIWIARFAQASFDNLIELGQLRAQAATLRAIEERLTLTLALGWSAVEELCEYQLDLQGQIHHTLLHSLVSNQPGRRAIELELQRCEAEQSRLQVALAEQPGRPTLERAVG